jgi:hypothetical protein
MRAQLIFSLLALALSAGANALVAQTPARDPSARLMEVLPADVAERVLEKIAEARARELPAAALEHRALKFAARGVPAADIERSVSEHADRLLNAKQALEAARGQKADSDELEAGAEALRKGVNGAELSELAKAAPSGRSLALPLYALGSLLDRGLPSDEAIQRVHDRLTARAADAEFQRISNELPPQAAAGQANRPALTGPDLAATKRPAGTPAAGAGRTGGPPTTIPSNAGKDTRPTPKKPTSPPGRSGGTGGQ